MRIKRPVGMTIRQEAGDHSHGQSRIAARTEASRDRGGSAATGSARGFCRSDRPYGNVPIKAIIGTRGLWRSGREVSE